MQFKTVNLIKHGLDKVWTTMRDDLPELAGMMDEIESVTEMEKTVTKSNYHIVNIWRSAIKLPQAIISVLGSDLFVWTDRADWNNETHVCTWSIEVHKFRDSVQCHGTTSFEPAMGGSGTKITFAGELEWDNRKSGGISGAMGEAFLAMGGDIIQSSVQKNFRKLAEAAAKYLDKK